MVPLRQFNRGHTKAEIKASAYFVLARNQTDFKTPSSVSWVCFVKRPRRIKQVSILLTEMAEIRDTRHLIVLDDGAGESRLQVCHVLIIIFIVGPMEASRERGLDGRVRRRSWGRRYSACRCCRRRRRGDGDVYRRRRRGGCCRGRNQVGFLSYCLGDNFFYFIIQHC